MSQLEPFELEGRLNGLRDALEIVLRHLIAQGGAQDLRAQLEARRELADQQEDPGAVPQAAFAVEAAAAREIKLLLERVEAGLEQRRT
ncbi:hypothetical protein [Stappia sp. WLB 29]|uniref:hypothetical protein n=1 Tax=Stappia sp. WLB 29 TaxID=2925220 RepID=UPI0020BD9844|nr:hypothetical protein [Stappia sp. WLB 29]